MSLRSKWASSLLLVFCALSAWRCSPLSPSISKTFLGDSAGIAGRNDACDPAFSADKETLVILSSCASSRAAASGVRAAIESAESAPSERGFELGVDQSPKLFLAIRECKDSRDPDGCSVEIKDLKIEKKLDQWVRGNEKRSWRPYFQVNLDAQRAKLMNVNALRADVIKVRSRWVVQINWTTNDEYLAAIESLTALDRILIEPQEDEETETESDVGF